jgi:hypothetical protein
MYTMNDILAAKPETVKAVKKSMDERGKSLKETKELLRMAGELMILALDEVTEEDVK